jgi:serine/threonine protein kinase/uncharacterized protein YjdB
MPTTLTCTGCGNELGLGSRFCPQCGAGVLSCAACGEPLNETDGYCAGCGAPATTVPGEPHPGSAWGEVVQRLRRATLSEFEVGPELGRGAMAAVFLAHEISLDRKVAIKVMSPGLLMDEGSADRFRREAITIAHLNHPNIVSVHSVRQAEGLHFFVMRYIRGRSLEHVIQQAGNLPIPIVRSILYQVGSALTYAHRSGVVHRDIKPANILIDEDGNAVVTDFGIAKVADQPSETHPGALVGTPAYMSPEQCSGAEVSGSSDQYSLGAVAYEMITGESPFSGSTLTVMQAHLEQQPQPIRDRCGECPPELERAVLRMLEKDPAARWPSIAQAKAALDAVPLGEEDPLLAQLCRLASPDSATSLPGKFMPGDPRTRLSSARPATLGLVRTISILPPPAALETGDSFNLVAMVRGEHGVPLPGRVVQWATDTPEVLRVDGAGGVATAAAPGSAQLSAACEGIGARLQVQVAPPMADEDDAQRGVQVATIQTSAPPKSVKAGDSFVLTATPVDSRGGLLLGRAVQWSTSDVSVAIVTASGWVAALGQGPVVLKATCDGASASVEMNVEAAAPGPKRERPVLPKTPSSQGVEEHRLARRRRGPRSRERKFLVVLLGFFLLTPVIWLTLQHVIPGRAQSSEMVPIAGGEVAQLTSAEGIAPILRGAPASVTIIRSPRRSLLLGASTRLLAEVRDASGRTVPGPSASWSSTNPAVARVDSATGWVHADRAGRVWVIAMSGEFRDSARIVVRRPSPEPPAAASVSISPHGSLWVGDTLTLTAAVLDGNGAMRPDAQVAWTSSKPQVVAIDPLSGRAQGYAPGTATIVASSGSTTASSRLTVLSPEATVDTFSVQAYEPEPGPPEKPQETAADPAVTSLEDRSAERARRDAIIRMGVLQCYDALRSKDVARVTHLYRPTKKSDEDKLNKLARILETEEWAAVVGERVDGARQLGSRDAAVTFSFQLVWKDAFGGRLTSRPVFRAEFAKIGYEWEMSSCRITGSPKL